MPVYPGDPVSGMSAELEQARALGSGSNFTPFLQHSGGLSLIVATEIADALAAAAAPWRRNDWWASRLAGGQTQDVQVFCETREGPFAHASGPTNGARPTHPCERRRRLQPVPRGQPESHPVAGSPLRQRRQWLRRREAIWSDARARRAPRVAFWYERRYERKGLSSSVTICVQCAQPATCSIRIACGRSFADRGRV